MQRVVHGMRGHAAKLGAGPVDDCLDIEMFAGIDRVEPCRVIRHPAPRRGSVAVTGIHIEASRRLEPVKNRCAKIRL